MPEIPARRSDMEIHRDHCRSMADDTHRSDAERAVWARWADDCDRWLAEGFGETTEEEEPLW